MRSPATAAPLGRMLVATFVVAAGCVIGVEQEPGCHTDADCGDGFSCTAGACFSTTTPPGNPASDSIDGGSDAADGRDGG